MTPFALLDALAQELEPLAEEMGFQVFRQFIPPKKRDDEPFQDYVMVSLGNGSQESEEATQQVVVTFGAEDRPSPGRGVFPGCSEDYQGYRDVVNLIEKVKQHLLRRRVIDEKFELRLPVQWVFPEEENYPYYFGGLLLNFTLPGMTEDLPYI